MKNGTNTIIGCYALDILYYIIIVEVDNIIRMVEFRNT